MRLKDIARRFYEILLRNKEEKNIEWTNNLPGSQGFRFEVLITWTVPSSVATASNGCPPVLAADKKISQINP